MAAKLPLPSSYSSSSPSPPQPPSLRFVPAPTETTLTVTAPPTVTGLFNQLTAQLQQLSLDSDECAEFRRVISTQVVRDTINKLRIAAGLKYIIDFRRTPLDAERIATGLRELVTLNLGGKEVDRLDKPKFKTVLGQLVARAIKSPPISPADFIHAFPTIRVQRYVDTALHRFAYSIRWNTATGLPHVDWPARWLMPASPPTNDERKAYVYRLLYDACHAEGFKLTFPQNSDLKFYTVAGTKQNVIIEHRPRASSAGNGTAFEERTLQSKPPIDSAIVRAINKTILTRDETVTGLRGGLGIYHAIFVTVDGPEQAAYQSYIGKAAAGTFDRWCVDKNNHVERVRQAIIAAAQGNLTEYPRDIQLVELELAAKWFLDPQKWADVYVLTVHHVTPAEIKTAEASSKRPKGTTAEAFALLSSEKYHVVMAGANHPCSGMNAKTN